MPTNYPGAIDNFGYSTGGDDPVNAIQQYLGTNVRPTAASVSGQLAAVQNNISGLVYNVRTYGATGSGTTDDYAAIAAAIAAVQAAGGGTLFFPPGTYVASQIPTITGSNILVKGAGPSSIIRLAPSSLVPTGETIGIWFDGATNVSVEDLAFDGNFANIAKSGAQVLPTSLDSATSLSAALTTTTLNNGGIAVPAAAPGTSSTFTVTSASGAGIVNGSVIEANSTREMMIVTNVTGNVVTATRGAYESFPGGTCPQITDGGVIGLCLVQVVSDASFQTTYSSTPFVFQIDSECFTVISGVGTNTWICRRGVNSTTIANHSLSAPIHNTIPNIGDGPNYNYFDNIINNTYGLTGYGPYSIKCHYRDQGSAAGIDFFCYLTYRIPLRFTDCVGFMVRGCFFYNVVESAILMNGSIINPLGNSCRNGLIEQNTFQFTHDNAVYAHGGVSELVVLGNTMEDGVYSGACGLFSDHVSMIGNTVLRQGPSFSDSAGLVLQGGYGHVMSDNIVGYCAFDGIQIENTVETLTTGVGGLGGVGDPPRTVTIENNNVFQCNAAFWGIGVANSTSGRAMVGINIFGGNDILIKGNQIQYCDAGVSLAISTAPWIEGNRFISCYGYGIQAGNSLGNIDPQIVGNEIDNCGWGNLAMIHDGAITGGTSLASASYVFSAVDIGKSVTTAYSGNLVGATGGTTITSVSAGVATLSQSVTNNTGLALMIFGNSGPGMYLYGPAVVKRNKFRLSGRDGITINGYSGGEGTGLPTAAATYWITDNDFFDNGWLSEGYNGITFGGSAVYTAEVHRNNFGGEAWQTFRDGTLSWSGSTLTLTSTTAMFQTTPDTDVGSTVVIQNAAATAGTGPIVGTVASVVNANQVTLTLSGQTGYTRSTSYPVAFAIQRGIGVSGRTRGVQKRAFYISNGASPTVRFTRNRCFGHRTETFNGSNYNPATPALGSLANLTALWNDVTDANTPRKDRASGTSSVPNTGSAVTFSHGLWYDPTLQQVEITMTGAPNNGVVTLVPTVVAGGSITVTAYSSAGAATTPTSGIGFAWAVNDAT